MKIEALVALTAAAQHLESIGTTRLQGFVKSLTVQGLLAEAPSCTPQQRVKWTKAAHELLTIFSRQMSSAQVLEAELHLHS